MAYYSDESVQEVINANDIVDVVSGYVQLKRAGRNYMGLCPFHREKTPSFIVSPDKQIYHCFGCNAGGNVVGFIMKIENIEFVEALELLAIRAGITLKQEQTGYVDLAKDLKERIYLLNAEVANHFYKNLYTPSGKIGLDYLYRRKLDDETIKKFGLGFSINANEMYQYLKQKGFTEEEILKSAIVEKKETRYVDKFRNRLMFPIVDIKNRVIAFGGRVLDDSKPKYINSPETIIYSKGRNLFALNVAKKEKFDKLVIVEGYMDTISLHQRGISNVVASLGTALTLEQAKLIRKYCNKVVIGYDADSAGQAAILRGLDILANAGCEVKVLKLDADDVKDPDEYVIKYGSGRLKNLIDNGITLVQFKLQLLEKKYDISIVDEKIKFLNEMATVIAAIDNEIEEDVYIAYIADSTKIGKDAIKAQVNKLKFKYANDLKNIKEVGVTTGMSPIKREKEQTIDKLEKYVIYLLLEKNVDIYNMIKDKISTDDIKNPDNKEIIKRIYQYYDEKKYENQDILQIFDDNQLQIISSTICLEYNIDNIQKTIEDLARNINRNKLEMRKQEILALLEDKNLENREELEKELNMILINIKKV